MRLSLFICFGVLFVSVSDSSVRVRLVGVDITLLFELSAWCSAFAPDRSGWGFAKDHRMMYPGESDRSDTRTAALMSSSGSVVRLI